MFLSQGLRVGSASCAYEAHSYVKPCEYAISLQAGVRRGQPVEILNYDASNALVKVDYAKVTQVGFDRAWVATAEGKEFRQGPQIIALSNRVRCQQPRSTTGS